MTEVTVTLPDDLIKQVRQTGLLHPEALAALLRNAMREHRLERLFATIDKLAELEPPLTEEEIAAEIKAARGGLSTRVAMTRAVDRVEGDRGQVARHGAGTTPLFKTPR